MTPKDTYAILAGIASELRAVPAWKIPAKSRNMESVAARRFIAAYMVEKLGYSCAFVGPFINRDRTSVHHMIRKHNDYMLTDKHYTRHVRLFTDMADAALGIKPLVILQNATAGKDLQGLQPA